MSNYQNTYFSNSSVELPRLELGEQVSRIPDCYPDLRDEKMAFRLDYQPPGSRIIDGRELEQLDKAIDSLEQTVEGSYCIWDDEEFEDGSIRYLETLEACMNNYQELFESAEILFRPELENREILEGNMSKVVEAIEATGLDGGYTSFKGFSFGGFDTVFVDEEEDISVQNPRFTAKIQSPEGMITAGYLSSEVYEGGSVEFGVKAVPDPDDDRVAGRMMGQGLDPENREAINLEEEVRELTQRVEELSGIELEESEPVKFEDDPIVDL